MNKQIILLIFKLGIIFVGGKAFGAKSTDAYKNLEANEFHISGEWGVNMSRPVLFFHNEKEGDCIIPLNEQNMEQLKMGEIQKKPIEKDLNFESKALKPCRAEIAKALLDSIDKESNQVALVVTPVLVAKAVVYIGFCGLAYYAIDKRNERVSIDSAEFMEQMTRATIGTGCFPIYVLSDIINWTFDPAA